MGEVCHHVCFQWPTPSRPQISLFLFLCLPLSQACWHLDSSEGRGERGSQRKDSPMKRDRASLLYPPKAWPGQRHLKSKRLKLLCHPYRRVALNKGKAIFFLLCRQETFKIASVDFFFFPFSFNNIKWLQSFSRSTFNFLSLFCCLFSDMKQLTKLLMICNNSMFVN